MVVAGVLETAYECQRVVAAGGRGPSWHSSSRPGRTWVQGRLEGRRGDGGSRISDIYGNSPTQSRLPAPRAAASREGGMYQPR